MIGRSCLIVLELALAVLVASAWAQQPAKIPVVGVLITHAPLTDPVVESIRSGFRPLGYEDGRNIRLEFVTAQGQRDRLQELAQQLVARNVDAIISPNELSARAAQKATTVIPIVMFAWIGDPVALGLIASYARPGGNITGIYSLAADLEAKRVEIIKEALPDLSHLAVFWDPSLGTDLGNVQRAAQSLGLRVSAIEVRREEDLEPAFKAAKQKKVGAVLLMQSPIFYVNRDRIAALALNARVAAVAVFGEQVRAGFFLSYGVDVDDIYKRAAYYVDRLLKGAKPGDLAVEQVSKFKLTVNQETARALNVKIPESILLRADEVVR
jgi:putative ABC transport system substrate-binding protein